MVGSYGKKKEKLMNNLVENNNHLYPALEQPPPSYDTSHQHPTQNTTAYPVTQKFYVQTQQNLQPALKHPEIITMTSSSKSGSSKNNSLKCTIKYLPCLCKIWQDW